MGVCGMALFVSASSAVPRRTDSPKNDRRWEENAEIQSILDETDALPPVVVPGKGRVPPLKAARLPRFSVKVMAKYRAPYPSLQSLEKSVAARPEQFPLMRAVLQGMKALQKHGYPLADTLTTKEVPIPAKLKAKIFKDQRAVAASMQELHEALDALEKAGKQKDREPSPRWQANYDFVRARLMMRIVHLHEYNLMLAMARRDALPPLANGQSGWRIISVSGLHGTERDFKVLNAKSRAILTELAAEHPGTPWAYLAKRDLDTLIGLDWAPVQ
jgi:hypothetical protein